MGRAELEAVIDTDPFDRAAYQVYADWLEGQGDPRAALIRLQCAETPADEEIRELIGAQTLGFGSGVLENLASLDVQGNALTEVGYEALDGMSLASLTDDRA